MFTYPPTFVPQQPVATLDIRPKKNRKQRRLNTHGKQTMEENMLGRLTPKQARELGL